MTSQYRDSDKPDSPYSPANKQSAKWSDSIYRRWAPKNDSYLQELDDNKERDDNKLDWHYSPTDKQSLKWSDSVYQRWAPEDDSCFREHGDVEDQNKSKSQSEKSLDVDRSTTLATVSLGLQRASSQALIDSGNRVVQKWRTEIKDGENARNTLVQQLKTLEGKNSELTVKLIQTEKLYRALVTRVNDIGNNLMFESSEEALQPPKKRSQAVELLWKRSDWLLMKDTQEHKSLNPSLENATARYIVHPNGDPVSRDEAGRVRATARMIWYDLHRVGLLPEKLGEIGLTALDHYFALMERKHPLLRLCENHWKSYEIFLDNYKHSQFAKKDTTVKEKPTGKENKRAATEAPETQDRPSFKRGKSMMPPPAPVSQHTLAPQQEPDQLAPPAPGTKLNTPAAGGALHYPTPTYPQHHQPTRAAQLSPTPGAQTQINVALPLTTEPTPVVPAFVLPIRHHLNPVLVTSQQPTRKQVPPLPSQHTALQLQQIPQSESLPLLPKETFATLSQQSRPQQIQTSQQTLSSHTQQDVPSSPPTPEFLPAPDAMSQLPSEFSAPLHSERSEFIFPDSQYSQSFQPSQPEAESKIIFEPGANLPQQLSLSASHPTPLIPTAVWDPMSRRAPDEPTVYNRSTSLVSQLKVASAKYSAKPRSNRSECIAGVQWVGIHGNTSQNKNRDFEAYWHSLTAAGRAPFIEEAVHLTLLFLYPHFSDSPDSTDGSSKPFKIHAVRHRKQYQGGEVLEHELG